MTPRAVLRTLVRPVEGNLPKISGLKSRERWGALSRLRASCMDIIQCNVASISYRLIRY